MRVAVKTWATIFAIGFFIFVIPALSAKAQSVMAGRDYALIDPAAPTDDTSKIEVAEFFSYACNHCNDLNPLIMRWAAKLPADVVFKRRAISGQAFYTLMARGFFTLETLGELERLDTGVFAAVHGKKQLFNDEKSLTQWVVSQGVDEKKFKDAFHSFGVDNKMKRANQLADLSKVKGVPAIVVDGRYLVAGSKIQSFADLLAATDKLIDKRRAERRTK